MRAEVDLDRLLEAVEAFEGTRSAEIDDDRILADLESSDMAALNEYLMKQGILLYHLAVERETLESVFMGLTDTGDGFGAVA